MSRNLSLNKAAPYLTASSVQGVKKTDTAPGFSPYIKKTDRYPEKEDNKKNQEKEATIGVREDSDAEEISPEIFKLIANPAFSELFALAVGKEDAKLMIIVKNIRKQRGVTNDIPVADIKTSIDKETATYLGTDTYFPNAVGEQFSGKM